MRTFQADSFGQFGQLEAVIIKTTYDCAYSEPDFNRLATVSFPLRWSCFGYQSQGREWLVSGNSVILERQETEFAVRKFKPFTEDSTLCIQLSSASETVDEYLPKNAHVMVFGRLPIVELRLRQLLATSGRLHWEQGLYNLLNACFLTIPNSHFKEGRRNFHQMKQVERAKDFIHEQYAEMLTIADMAAAANFSPFHFSRLFRQETGCSPYDYLLQIRLERARQLLSAGGSASEAAFSSGFNSLENFSLCFKKMYGCAPIHFQKRKIY